MTKEAQHASDKVLQECAEINEQFDKLLSNDGAAHAVTRQPAVMTNGHGGLVTERQDTEFNPYVDSVLAQAQHRFAPEANAEFEAQHNFRAQAQPQLQPMEENPYHRHNYYKEHQHPQEQQHEQEHEEELEAFISKFEAEASCEEPPRDEKVPSDQDEMDGGNEDEDDYDGYDYGDRECIEGCEPITPSNFGSMRAGDVVSMLMSNLWTYYRVVRVEENGGALVAEFESGFASADPEESVYIKHGAINRFVTVWAEQTAAPAEYHICRELAKTKQATARTVKPAENGWVKLQSDGKLYLVMSYDESTGMATLKGIGQEEEKRVNLDVCAHKVL